MMTKLEKLLGDQDPEEILDFTPMAVVLENGDVLITELAEIDEKNYCMLCPFRLADVAENNGSVSLMAIRYVPGSIDIFFHIDADKIVTTGIMTEEMFKLYTRASDALIAELSSVMAKEDAEAQQVSSTPSSTTNVLEFKPKTVH